MNEPTLADDPPLTIRRSRSTGAILIRLHDGWVRVPQKLHAHDRWAQHYTDVGGWNDRLDLWELLEVQRVG